MPALQNPALHAGTLIVLSAVTAVNKASMNAFYKLHK